MADQVVHVRVVKTAAVRPEPLGERDILRNGQPRHQQSILENDAGSRPPFVRCPDHRPGAQLLQSREHP
ncbi:Uncharacterised protein [Mycobacteroides abscessus subsp. massiliense]|nr:Uncharacterised protein [Mycobacteroides abscessus subsp. massiliense]